MKRFILKTVVIFAISVMIIGYVDFRKYVAYDKKDGLGKVEEVEKDNRGYLKSVENRIREVFN